jgi:glyoxylase-like metal-dependent hydrolase (beta-lactamase superfamily II)
MGSVSVLQVRPNVYMLTVQGSNFALLTEPQGSVVVDSGGTDCEAVVAAVRQVSRGPVRFVIETSDDPDRVGCADALSNAGNQFGYMDEGGIHTTSRAPIFARESLLARLIPQGKNFPTEAFSRPTMSFSVGGQGVQVMGMPAAHTDGDAFVVLRQANVVVTGNVFDMTRFPVIDVDRGGSIQGEIDALNRLVEELTIPATPKWQGWYGTLIIPGRGHLSNQLDATNYRDMLTVVRDRVAALIKQGRTLEQVHTADPTRGYAQRYGTDQGSWTTRQFVEAVYKSLQPQRRSARKS